MPTRPSLPGSLLSDKGDKPANDRVKGNIDGQVWKADERKKREKCGKYIFEDGAKYATDYIFLICLP